MEDVAGLVGMVWRASCGAEKKYGGFSLIIDFPDRRNRVIARWTMGPEWSLDQFAALVPVLNPRKVILTLPVRGTILISVDCR